MDDSGQDFVELCSKLLKRVRKKPGEQRWQRKEEQQPSSQTCNGVKRKKNHKADVDSGSKPAATQPVLMALDQEVVCGGLGNDAGKAERSLSAKEKVVQRMQQFKRASPQKMSQIDESSRANHKDNSTPLPPLAHQQESPETFTSGCHLEPESSDEALALQLQRELDREATQEQTVNLEDRGLYFCHICHKDLTRMTAEGRTQHVNRCLDESEGGAAVPPAPPPSVPDCPICGKKFKSQKSRAAHLKRCSSDMGVSPAVLLQALQRQAEETQNIPAANTLTELGGTKGKGPVKPGLPAKKKPRQKANVLDEDTMMALALSSSLLEQEKQSESAFHTETAATPLLKRRADTGKGRGKKKKRGPPRPPPLLLIQDAQAALSRLQERVSALLLRSRPPSPPTPTLCPSSLQGWCGAAPLWQKSSLVDGASTHVSDLYAAALRGFFMSSDSATTHTASSSTIDKSGSSLQAASEGCPVVGTQPSILPSTQTSASSKEQLPVSSQVFRDLMDLAEEGMILSQCGISASYPDKENSAGLCVNRLSGFVQEESEDQADLCASGFLPETIHARSGDNHNQTGRITGHLRAESEHKSVALLELASDLSSMVNNPQLSDVQLQVDSGEVYYAHSFMVYARCPLLAEMVHESGFSVQEEDMPRAQRVLMSDVPGEAVRALLQYLYTAQCCIPASLQPHVLELASRFDLKQLEQLCELRQEDTECQGDEDDSVNQENVDNRTDQAFVELLRSMWNEDDEATDTDGRRDEEKVADDCQTSDLAAGDGELHEERVNEEELEEIYEFAATQRKREEEEDSMEEEDKDGEVFTKPTEPEKQSTGIAMNNLQMNPLRETDSSLDRSYSHLFSESCCGADEEGVPSCFSSASGQLRRNSPTIPQSQKVKSAQKSSSTLSGRAVLQSSASITDDLSLSTSNLPIPGPSPDQDQNCEPQEGLLKRESLGPRSIGLVLSPNAPQKRVEPELIVLSDSSSEMEVEPHSRSPSPRLPHVNYTHIRPQPDLKPSEVSLEDNKSTSVGRPESTAADVPSPPVCSPEVSWLIPSTPLLHEKSTTSSSTQTRSSMCKMRLFPKQDASSCVFTSPALPLNKDLQVSCSPTRISACTGPAGGDVEVKQRESAPYSSTPLHPKICQPPVPLTTSLQCGSFNKQRLKSQEKEQTSPESPEKIELGSFHISALSDPSDPPSSPSKRAPQISEKSHQSHQVLEFSIRHNPESDVIRMETRGEEVERGNKYTCDEELQEEAQVSDSSFRQSFMYVDEPPIAFNDSWGLDVCTDANPDRFSLRLEDSERSSQQERLPSSSTERAPTSPSDSVCFSPPKAHGLQLSTGVQAQACTSPHRPTSRTPPELSNSLLDSKIWDSWDEEEDDEALPLSQRVNPSAHLKTPASSHNKRRRTLVPITPMPHYSDMDTPELKNKLNRFGVRPLPKRQMILKLKEIHQYTHQLVNSDSEDEAPSACPPAAGSRTLSSAQALNFKEPSVPRNASPLKHNREKEAELLSASQGSSSTAASEDSERSNPELGHSSDGDSDTDGGISASQAATSLQDRLQAVRAFILSDSELYTQILEYRPLLLSQFQEKLKAAGIRLGSAKLGDYLDSQCITFTTAKPGHSAASRCRRKRMGKKAQSVSETGPSRKRGFPDVY